MCLLESEASNACLSYSEHTNARCRSINNYRTLHGAFASSVVHECRIYNLNYSPEQSTQLCLLQLIIEYE